jgi:hypothetical protein
MATSSKTYTPRDLASILGRNQGPELFFQQPFAADQSPIIPKAINVNRPLERIHMIFTGTVTIAGANYTAVAAEAPQTIISRVRLTGQHSQYGQLTPIDVSGATLFALARLTRERGSSLYINGVRQPELNVPLAQAPATFGNIGVYALEIHYDIPLGPILPVASKISTIPYHFMNANWGDTLQLQIFFGDATSFGTPAGGTVVTFSANSILTIFTNYEILGPLSTQIASAVVVRSEQIQQAPVAANGNAIRLQLMQKQKTTNIFFKSGTLLAGSGPGVTVFGTMSDAVLDMTQAIVDNKPIHNNFNNHALKEYSGYVYSTVLPGGYNNITFEDSQNPLTYYRGDLLAGGSTFELDTNVIGGGAGVAVQILQEQVIGEPGGAMSASTATPSASS